MQKQYLVFLVKRKESRDFDVFFGVFLGVFWCLGERKKQREQLGKRQISDKCVSSLSGACLGLFIALDAKIEVAAIVRPLASILL